MCNSFLEEHQLFLPRICFFPFLLSGSAQMFQMSDHSADSGLVCLLSLVAHANPPLLPQTPTGVIEEHVIRERTVSKNVLCGDKYVYE